MAGIVLLTHALLIMRLFQDPERLRLVMKGGAVYRQRL
jgi:hypothetical protein